MKATKTVSKKTETKKPAKAAQQYEVRVEDYKGQPIFQVHSAARVAAGEEYTQIVGFGLTKAKAVLANLEALKAYVAEYDKKG